MEANVSSPSHRLINTWNSKPIKQLFLALTLEKHKIIQQQKLSCSKIIINKNDTVTKNVSLGKALQ
jgi:hypothetical protein